MPSAAIMKPSCEIVEYASTRFTSFWATAMVAASGDIYRGLWYPIVVALMTFVIGALFLRDRKDFDIHA